MKSRNSTRRRRFLVGGRHLAGGHLEAANRVDGAVALVVMAMAGQRAAVRQLQIALRPLQRLDRGLLVDAEDDRVLRRADRDRARRSRRPWRQTPDRCSRTTTLRAARSIFWARRKRQTYCTRRRRGFGRSADPSSARSPPAPAGRAPPECAWRSPPCIWARRRARRSRPDPPSRSRA